MSVLMNIFSSEADFEMISQTLNVGYFFNFLPMILILDHKTHIGLKSLIKSSDIAVLHPINTSFYFKVLLPNPKCKSHCSLTFCFLIDLKCYDFIFIFIFILHSILGGRSAYRQTHRFWRNLKVNDLYA